MSASERLTGLAAHQDVLQAAIPDDDTRRTSLIAELKSRAKTCLVSKHGKRPEVAIKLYERAVEVAKHESGKSVDELKALYSNISMSYLMMGKYQEALGAAEDAIDRSDSKWPKAFFRKGRALNGLRNYNEAIKAFRIGLELAEEENSKADIKLFKKEIQKSKDAQLEWERSKERQAAAEEKEKEKDRERIQKYHSKSKTNTESKTSGTSLISEAKNAEVDADVTFLKGYKKKSDGRTTSYFDTERSAKDLELIGDITPKRISKDEAKSMDIEQTDAGGSAWNQKGTFEEKNYSKWAKERLMSQIKAIDEYDSHGDVSKNYSSSSSPFVVQVNKVSIGETTACVIAGRKKKKYIWQFDDIEVVLDCHFEDEGKGSSEEATLIVRECGSDDGNIDDVECEVQFKKAASDVRSAKQLKKAIQNEIATQVRNCIKTFAESFPKEK